MAQLMTINLTKGESPNLGFRLQGGVDFAAPLVIQKVNGGSPADRAGLQAGDAVIKINSTDIFNLRHKDAQDVIIKAGPSFAITVQRGGSTWKPSVVPTGSLSQGAISPVTKTSLAAKPQPSIGAIGTGHNVAAKPFLNGTANGAPKLVNKQYNSPIGLYSEQSIAETLSAQSEVLSTGVLGVNFKKNEKNYDATKSAVYHMLQEAENDPRSEPEPLPQHPAIRLACSSSLKSNPRTQTEIQSRQRDVQESKINEEDQVDSGLSPPISNFGLKHVQAPENKPTPPTPQLPPGQNICADCERLIVGVFVRIKDKNLHVECFKCSTCGASLKNVGYYNINNKLYCDVHAKLAAKANPPGPNLVPVTLPPGGRAPAGTISAALSIHPLPTQAPLSPKIGPASPSTNITAAPFLPDNRLPPDDLDVNSNHKKDYDTIDARLLKSLTIAASRKGNANTNKIASITSIGRKSNEFTTQTDETAKSDANIIFESNAVAPKDYDDFTARKAITAASRKSDANIDDNKLTSMNTWNNEANVDEFVAHEANQTKFSPYRPLPIPYSQFATKVNKAGYTNAPRPFSSVVAPLSPNSYSKPLPRTPVAPPPSIPTPTSAPVSAPGYFTAKPAGGMPKDQGRLVYNIVWPPVSEEPELPTASPLYFPPPSQVKIPQWESCEQISCVSGQPSQTECCYKTSDQSQREESCNTSVCEQFSRGKSCEASVSDQFDRDYTELEDYTNTIAAMDHQKMSLCSSEVCNLTGRKSLVECAESLTETLQTQMLVDSIIKNRPKSPPPLNVDVVEKVERKASLHQGNVEERCCQNTKEVKSVCSNPCNKSCCNQNCPTCPFKEPADLKFPHDYQKAEELKGKVKNSVPHKYEAPMVTALKTTPSKPVCISPDIFTYIPSKHSGSALASALSIAPSEPFNPVQSVSKAMEPVPLPEVTVPYFPPEHPIIPIEPKPVKKEIAKPDSPFVEALKVAPERPFTPIGKGPTPIKQKPPPDPLLKDLPKPQQRMTMLEALTTTSDRTYSPLIPDIVTPVKEVEVKAVEPKKVIKLPQPQPFISTMVNTFEGSGEQSAGTNFPPVSIELQHESDRQVQMMHEQGLRHQELIRQEMEMKQIQKQEIIHMEQMQKQELYHREEIQKQEMYQKQDMRQERIERERFQQKQEMHQQSEKHVKIAEKEKRDIAKQSEEVIMKKPMPLTAGLHKSEYIPQYQTSLQYDEEIQLPHHKNINKLLQPKQSKIVPEPGPLLRPQPHHDTITPPPQITKPVQIVQSGNPNPGPQGAFQPVQDDFRPPSSAMPQRLGNPATPSMINKPPSAIPYYQQNLVATQYLAPDVNVFDPKSPATSRSPSPCLGARERSPSPFRHAPRARSPAPGPPPNPLKKHEEPKQGPQFQHEFQKEKAKDSVTGYIPQHREHFQGILKKEGNYYDQLSDQRMVMEQTESRSQIAGQNYQQQNYEASTFRAQDSKKHQTAQVGNMSVSVSEEEKLAQLQKLNKSQTQSVETSPDSRVQVQRKKTVTEEFERTHKEKTIEIEKRPFQKVNVPQIEEQGIIGLHVTNPHALNSPFLRNQPQHPPPVVMPEQKIEKRTIAPCRSQAPAPAPQVPPPHPPSKFSVPVPPISAPSSAQNVKPSVPAPSVGSGSGRQASSVFAPKRGRGVLNMGGMSGNRMALCGSCHQQIRYTQHETETEIVCTNDGVQITTKTIEIGRKSPDDYNQINVTIPMPVFSPSLSSSDGSPSPSLCSGDGGVNSKITNDYYTSAKNNYLETTFPTRYETAEIRNEATQTNNNNSRTYTCICCQGEFRGPFITALGKIWCPDHFVCATPSCKRPLQDIGFVEEQGQLHCEYCFERYLAPDCSKCNSKIKGDCLKAIGKNFHPECFNCAYCGKLFGNSPFFLEDGLPYCETDWNEMFTTKCFACGFPVEAGDRWVEALSNNYHSQCFNCTMCKKNLEGQSFFAKGGRPFCKNHAR